MSHSTYYGFLKQMHIPTQKYQTLRRNIKSGDILLCSGTDIMSRMIQKETNSRWSHVGLIRYDSETDRMLVYESVEERGVRCIPLSHYLTDYNDEGKAYAGDLLIARHTDFLAENAGILFSKASDFLGKEYDKKELLKIAFKLRFPYPNHDSCLDLDGVFICSEYAYICFKAAGVEIAHRGDCITPNDFFADPSIKPLSYITT